MRRSCVAVVRGGLERLCATELAALGVKVRRHRAGRVPFTATERDTYRACVWLRTASRVLVHLGGFKAASFPALLRRAAEVDLDGVVPPGATVDLKVTAQRSRLHHTGAVAERLQEAFGREVREGGQPLVVELADDEVQVWADATGPSLDHRGWRLAGAKAPLPPTVAAAVLRLAGYDGSGPLLDPLCGAGTIPIEAALMASDRPPAVGRDWALESWPSFARGTWASVHGEVTARAGTPPHVVAASDRDEGAVEATRANAARAGVALDARAAALSAAAVPAGERGWLVTNPPWGGRLEGRGDLRDLYASLGALVRARCTGWRVALVSADSRLVGHTGLGLAQAGHVTVGGRRVGLHVSAS